MKKKENRWDDIEVRVVSEDGQNKENWKIKHWK